MADLELMRSAFNLTDGWGYDIEPEDSGFVYLTAADGTYWHLDEEPIHLEQLPRIFVDALAVKLMRQANEEVYGEKFKHYGDSIDLIRTIVRWQEHRRPKEIRPVSDEDAGR